MNEHSSDLAGRYYLDLAAAFVRGTMPEALIEVASSAVSGVSSGDR